MSESRALALAWKHDNAEGITTRLEADGRFKITGWPDHLGPVPDDAGIATIVAQYETAMVPVRARDQRRDAYPAVGDQLSALWRAIEATGVVLPPEAQAVADDIAGVKARFPKGGA
jgi:hypothetical protein